MGIIKKNKNVIGVIKNGHPVTKIYKGNFIFYNAVQEFDIDLEFKEINGTYGQAFKINDISITPTGSTYQANLADLGIENVTSFNFSNTNLSKINRFPDTSQVKSLNSKFSYTQVKTLDLQKWNLQGVEDAKFAFSYIPNVETISFEYIPSLESFQGLYGGCAKLKRAKIPDLSKTTNLSYLFYGCSSLTDIDGPWVSTRLEDVSHMFEGCSSLDMQSLMRSGGKLPELLRYCSPKNVSGLFKGCNFGYSPFNSSYLSQWQMNHVEDASYLFANTNASDYQLYYWDMWRCKNWSHMFENCTSLTNISFANKDFAGAEDFSYMFAGCTNLATIDLQDIVNFPMFLKFEGMFNDCTSLQKIYVNDSNLYDLFTQALQLLGMDPSIVENTSDNGGGSSANSEYFEWHKITHDTPRDVAFTTIKIDRTIKSGADGGYFYVFSTQENDEWGMFPEWAVSTDEDMICDNDDRTYMYTLTDKDVYVYTFSQPVYFSLIQENAPEGAICYGTPLKTTEISDKIEWEWQDTGDGLTSIYINGDANYYSENPAEEWNGIDNNSCYTMFDGTNITKLNVMRNTYNVTNMNSMFRECQYLTSIDISDWNTSQVDNLNEMFFKCENLDTVVMKNWDVSNVQYTMNMFFDCTKLRVLDLSGWNLTYDRLVNHSDMFYNCTNLEKIILIGSGNDTQTIIENALSDAGLFDQVEIVTEASE